MSLSHKNGSQQDITPLLGDWVNSNSATEWITKFTLARKGDTFTISTSSARKPFNWGEVEITTYSDNIGETAFVAFYDLGFVKSHLAANTNKGLIVIAAFHRFDDSERPNFLCREFYYRER